MNLNEEQQRSLERMVKNNIWSSDIWDGASYETNEFGDNWKRGPKTDKVDRKVREIELWNKLRMDVFFWPLFLGGPWLLVLWAIIFR